MTATIDEKYFPFSEFTSDVKDIVYHDDIEQDKKDPDVLLYKVNKKIKVADIGGCALMIYLGKYLLDDYFARDIQLDDNDMLDFIAWKKILVDQGRIDKYEKVQMFTNCCS